jgi:hypothetical protein
MEVFMNRGISLKRHLDNVKKKKKIKILKRKNHLDHEDIDDRVKGKLVKGKVHCSCSMCQTKTKNDGWKHSDLKKMQQ